MENKRKIDPMGLFQALYTGFLEADYIRALPPENVYEEQVLDLMEFRADALEIPCPENITFGIFRGDRAKLYEAIAKVDEDWIQWYPEDGEPAFCAYDGEKVVSFCLLDKFGSYNGMLVGGPGCVGTVPEYRKLGIGLKMVQLATEELKRMGYDLSYIHYTSVGHWYARLGYRTVVRWNRDGVMGN